jgi:hypothetical protein
MPEIGTSGSMSGDGKRSVATWPKLPRPSSTLPSRRSLRRTKFRRNRRHCLAGTFLLDHLVGAGEQSRRHVEAQRLGGLEINYELELGRSLDG